MRDFTETIFEKDSWEAFYTFCQTNEHTRRAELMKLRQFIDCGGFLPWASRIRAGEAFPYPQRAVLNKKGTAKKRVVFMFPDEGGIILKYFAYCLHEYDGIFANNLYSFRVNRGVKRAVADILSVPGLDGKFVYKLDIHDYFNSVDTEKILPMLRDTLGEEQKGFLAFLTGFLRNPYVSEGGKTFEEPRKGIMAGNPLSAFMANLFLSDMDRHFMANAIPYARYSDDIIVFADSEEELAAYREEILKRLSERALTVNPKKVFHAVPGEPWDFLGITYRDGAVDVARASVEKLKGKMRRKAKALYRWKQKKGAGDEQAIRAFLRHFNKKLYNNPNHSELTWARWFFPVITTDESLKELDAYLIANARYLVTGKHGKSNYNLRYETIREYGFKSLVHAYYETDRGGFKGTADVTPGDAYPGEE